MAVMTLSDKLDQLGTRYDELTQQLSTAELVSDSSKFQKVAKQHAELEEIVAKHREFKQIEKGLAGGEGPSPRICGTAGPRCACPCATATMIMASRMALDQEGVFIVSSFV